MKITRIDLPGFGCLKDFAVELSPGLNVICGENEAGKSTLQAATAALLYGFFDNERALKHETERYERFRPWFGGTYRGSLEYELASGDRYEVRRDFANDVDTQLIDVTTGLDVARQFGRGRHGNVPFARRHLGMPRAVFQSCAFISQGEIFEVTHGASPNQIGDAVAALADSARRDVSAARAVERLDTALARIGSDRARTVELPKARARLARIREEISFAEAARDRASENARRLQELRDDIARLRSRFAETQAKALKVQTAAVRERLAAVLAAEREAAEASSKAERLVEYTSFPASLRDEVLALRGRFAELRASVQQMRDEQSDATDAVSSEDRLEYETARSGVGALTEEQVRTIQTAAFEMPRRGPAALIAAALRAVARALSRMARRLLRCPPSEKQETAVISLSTEEAQALLERHRRYLTLKPRVEAADRLATELSGKEAALESIERQLRSLVASPEADAMSIEAGLSQFEDRWRKHLAYREATVAAEEARRRLEAALAGRTREEMEERLVGCERMLTDTLAKHPELADLQSNLQFDQLVQQRDALRDELEQAQIQESALDQEVRSMLEGQRPTAELEEELARWKREVDRLETARSALTLAREQIAEAMVRVYRDFAPAVNTFLSEGVEQVTGGRYTRAHVDPASLRVSLLLPETGQVITDPPVSHGTRAMVYVLMRVGLAQHMSAIGEPVPLILDDPFVDVDATRLPRMLDFLLTLSDRMQVLLFTKEEAIARWFEQNAPGTHHRLHRLTETKLIRVIL
ncbi:MAG TPA: AAA family ATPase [Dehalococcoidia bacterium]|nr:AAA family ATPase [Dehalococcoidia bacterium]